MSVPTNNPVEYTYTSPDAPPNSGSTATSIPHPPKISKVVHVIAGIRTTVYGLAELPKASTEVTVLWLLHPRLQTESCMAPFASHLITHWNNHTTSQGTAAYPSSSPSTSKSPKGLIAVSFDQRNHGTREVHALSNEAWRSGNETHAQDMFSSYHGTALDMSLLLDYLAAYIFPSDERQIAQNIVMGISLGGHAAWHCVMQDTRVSAAIVVIGCPDYTRLMSDRARLSKRKTYTETKPPGAGFVGSRDFPPGLVDAVRRYDPAGLLWGTLSDTRRAGQEHHYDGLSDEEKARLVPVLTRCLGGKRVLNLSGGADKLVPYAAGKPFLDWIKAACGSGGWFEGGNLRIEDVIVPGAGHEVPPEMVTHMESFLLAVMEDEKEMTVSKKGRRESRI